MTETTGETSAAGFASLYIGTVPTAPSYIGVWCTGLSVTGTRFGAPDRSLSFHSVFLFHLCQTITRWTKNIQYGIT